MGLKREIAERVLGEMLDAFVVVGTKSRVPLATLAAMLIGKARDLVGDDAAADLIGRPR